MDENFEKLLTEMEQFGKDNDASVSEQPYYMKNITRDTGELLAVLVRATNARRILEIGTSNGYSTLWIARAARDTGGKVTTIEHSAYKYELAEKNFEKSGIASYINQVQGDAGNVLSQQENGFYDMVFLDSDRTRYALWWNDIKRVLRPGGLLVVDNATSHSEEMKPLMNLVKSDAGFVTCLVPVGKGEFLATKSIQI